MTGFSTGAPIVKIYHEKSTILPDVARVMACLYEKDIMFETVLTASSHKDLIRSQASSHTQVPFFDGSTTFQESREICHYITETYQHRGYPFLLEKYSLERASIQQWLHHEEHAFDPPSRSLFCHLAFCLDDEDEDVEFQARKLAQVLEIYDQRLSVSGFLAGDRFTIADLVHLPNLHYIASSDKFAYLFDSRKNLGRWWNSVSSRVSWQCVLRDMDAVEQQHKQEELEEQQQLQTEHPTATRRKKNPVFYPKHSSTKSQTVLVPPPAPVGVISTSSMPPQAEKKPL